jgi:hypothetical protein
VKFVEPVGLVHGAVLISGMEEVVHYLWVEEVVLLGGWGMFEC